MNCRSLFAATVLLLASLTALHAQDGYWRATNAAFGSGVESIAVRADGEILAGTESDGLFRSTDGGDSWSAVNDEWASSEISSIVVAPDGTLFVGVYRDGLFRSTDNGQSWWMMDESRVRALLLASNGDLYWARTAGLWRSTDRGASWSSTGLDEAKTVSAIAIDSTGALLVGLFPDGEIWRSTDGGANWAKTGFSDATFASYIASIVVTPSGVLVSGQHGVFVSDDDGETWAAPGPSPASIVDVIAVGPDGRLFATPAAGVFESTDGGAFWTLQGSGWLGDAGESESVAFAPDRRIVVGTTNGNVLVGREPVSAVGPVASMRKTSTGFGTIYPNPCSDHASVRFDLDRPGPVLLRLFTMTGVEVGTAFDGTLPAGKGAIPLDLSNLSAGAYLCRIETIGGVGVCMVNVLGR